MGMWSRDLVAQEHKNQTRNVMRLALVHVKLVHDAVPDTITLTFNRPWESVGVRLPHTIEKFKLNLFKVSRVGKATWMRCQSVSRRAFTVWSYFKRRCCTKNRDRAVYAWSPPSAGFFGRYVSEARAWRRLYSFINGYAAARVFGTEGYSKRTRVYMQRGVTGWYH